MARYCVNKNAQPTGEHEVHNLDIGCIFLPAPRNQQPLGDCEDCSEAITRAQEYYSIVDSCAYCTPECHTQ